jgi:glutathione S-transferase
MDAQPALQGPIGAVVAGHYAISIEDLTFGKWMLGNKVLARVFPGMLQRAVQSLDKRAAAAADGGASLRAKAELNRQRLAYFSEGCAPEKLAQRQQEVRDFVAALPLVSPGEGLFGPHCSRADVVVAVLFARLAMIDEFSLVTRADLLAWWDWVQLRPPFRQADIWTRLHRRRLLQAAWQAHWDPIVP